MIEEEKGVSDAPEQSVSDSAQEVATANAVGDSNDSVKYDTYKRTLSEAKKHKSRAEELQTRLMELEQNQLAAEGKKDELIDSLKNQLNEWKGKATTAVSNFAKSKVHETMMAEATRLGCQDPELLIRAYGSDIDGIDFDDSFNPDKEQLRATLDRIKTERPYLFNKPGPQIANHQIKSDGVKEPEAKSISKMKDDELMAAWAKANSKA